MPAAIDPLIKKQVIKQYLSGDSRDRIAAGNGIGAGTVSNIVNEWKKGVRDSVATIACYKNIFRR
jgi:transposase